MYQLTIDLRGWVGVFPKSSLSASQMSDVLHRTDYSIQCRDSTYSHRIYSNGSGKISAVTVQRFDRTGLAKVPLRLYFGILLHLCRDELYVLQTILADVSSHSGYHPRLCEGDSRPVNRADRRALVRPMQLHHTPQHVA